MNRDIKPGDRVRISTGLAAGRHGTVVRPWTSMFGSGPRAVALWVVASEPGDLVPERVMRADHLAVVS